MGERKISKKSRKLFHKYLRIITSVILLCVIILCSTYIVIATKNWNNEQLSVLTHNAEIIAENSEEIMEKYSSSKYNFGANSDSDSETDTTPLTLICNTMKIMSDAIDADIFITDMSGNVVVCKEMIGDRFSFNKGQHCIIHSGYNIDESIIEKASEENYSEIDTLGGIFIRNQLTVASPIKLDGKTVAIVFATEPITVSWYSYARKIFQIMIIAILLSLVVSFITVYILSDRLTRPLREMSEATKRYANGDFSYKVKVKGKGEDELSQLAEAFNSMATSLSALESSRRSFVANVSHELKTPMTSIGGFIDGMLDGTIPEEKYPHYLSIVSDEVKRLSRLVTGMLNMSKLEAGEMPMNVKRFDLSENLFKTLLSFEKKINDKQIDIEGLDKLESTYINGDEDMLTQVVYNLIDNAVKFTPQNGYIRFKTYSDPEKIYVSIRNSGSGIEKEELDKIFERFYKVDKSRSYDVKGAGLGLYLVKSIIELHGGEIKATSEVGEYTEFAFWLPNV